MCLHNEIWWKREFFVVDSQTPKDWPTANFTGSGLRCSTVNQPAKATPQPSGGGVGWFRCQQLSMLRPSWLRVVGESGLSPLMAL